MALTVVLELLPFVAGVELDEMASLKCDARMADGAIRGAMMGALWSAFFGASDLHRELREVAGKRHTLLATRYTLLSVLGFGGFFGIYNGLLCQAESRFGTESVAGPVLVGGSLGAAIGASIRPWSITNVGVISVLCASVSATTAGLLLSSRR